MPTKSPACHPTSTHVFCSYTSLCVSLLHTHTHTQFGCCYRTTSHGCYPSQPMLEVGILFDQKHPTWHQGQEEVVSSHKFETAPNLKGAHHSSVYRHHFPGPVLLLWVREAGRTKRETKESINEGWRLRTGRWGWCCGRVWVGGVHKLIIFSVCIAKELLLATPVFCHWPSFPEKISSWKWGRFLVGGGQMFSWWKCFFGGREVLLLILQGYKNIWKKLLGG